MKITYSIWHGSVAVAFAQTARSAEEINKVLKELNSIESDLKTLCYSAHIAKVEVNA